MCSSAPFMTVYPKKAILPLTPAIPCRRRSKLVLSTQRWMALGGITLEHLPEIAALGFGGAVLLGDVWQQAKEAFIPHFLHLKQLSSHPFNF